MAYEVAVSFPFLLSFIHTAARRPHAAAIAAERRKTRSFTAKATAIPVSMVLGEVTPVPLKPVWKFVPEAFDFMEAPFSLKSDVIREYVTAISTWSGGSFGAFRSPIH
eukprot:GFKZ01001570.1.p3 GENE.GFKZ01001570.1~~GFKZ01001570.1.p3  ORF type:complete len:108 (+),score=10.91 GFKZ01001570.1:1297-1620(+)